MRDAREYRGPLPVVAHPPCARWCRLAKEVQSLGGKAVGDDDGCFASALASVRQFGGVLEHPAFSLAWPAYGLIQPRYRVWQRSTDGYYVAEVNQAAYGHRAEKRTWLLYVGTRMPAGMNWTRAAGQMVVTKSRRLDPKTVKQMPHAERSITPPAFAEALIQLAANCGGPL